MNRIDYDLPRVIWEPPAVEGEQDCACDVDPPRVWGGGLPAEAETDCACPDAGWALATHPSQPDLAWTVPPLYRASLPDGHELLFDPVGACGVAVLNRPARQVLEAFLTPKTSAQAACDLPDMPPTVVRDTFSRLAALGLLAPAHATEHAPHPMPHTLTLWLHLTTRCNLNCLYCYAPPGNADMSAEVGRMAVDGAIRSARTRGFRTVKLKYAGGEPTLNFRVVQEVHAYAREAMSRAGLDLREVFLSNGVALTQEMLCWLRDEKVRLSISLDGLGLSHDRQRRALDGGSSHQTIRAVENALVIGLRPHLSITVTTYNVDALPAVVAFALERDLSFNLNFVRPLPDGPDLTASPEQLIAGVRAALAVLEKRLPRRRLVDGLLDRCNLAGPHAEPCSAGRSYLVVDPRGRVASCHMEMGRTIGSVWEEDPLLAITATSGDFHVAQPRGECRRCLWRYVCAGGCPLVARSTGDGRSPYCEVYRTVLPELLRLEALRLLKWHV